MSGFDQPAGGAASLTSAVSLLGSAQSIGQNLTTTILTTGALAVGVWSLAAWAYCQGAANGIIDLILALGTAVGTFDDGNTTRGTSFELGGGGVPVAFGSIAGVLTITTAGTVLLRGNSSSSGSTATARSFLTGAHGGTGVVAVKIG